jgi:hypothetical protein
MAEDYVSRFACYGGWGLGTGGEDCGTSAGLLGTGRGWSMALVVWECCVSGLLGGSWGHDPARYHGVDEHAADRGRQRGR